MECIYRGALAECHASNCPVHVGGLSALGSAGDMPLLKHRRSRQRVEDLEEQVARLTASQESLRWKLGLLMERYYAE